jgi:hypothetical protein
MAITFDCIVVDTLLDVGRTLLAIHRLRALVDGRDYPYTTPLDPKDRVGPDDGSTVEIKRIVRPYKLADGKFAVPITPVIQRLLDSGKLADVKELTALQRTKLATAVAARRQVTDGEVTDEDL